VVKRLINTYPADEIFPASMYSIGVQTLKVAFGVLLRFLLAVVLISSPALWCGTVGEAGTVRGQTGARLPNGVFVPAANAKVYVFYDSEYTNRSFTHRPDTSTAGGQFHYNYRNVIERDKELKALQKAGNSPSDQRAMDIAEHMLKATDEAIALTMDWASKHPKDAWQVVVLAADEQGAWATNGLPPGSYDVVIRGIVSRLNASWEFSFDLSPGATYSVPLAQPRFFRPIS
jgi:hypothetical protein